MAHEISFRNIPYAIKNGSLLNILGFNVGPIPGFNSKNKKDRTFWLDQDNIIIYPYCWKGKAFKLISCGW